MTNGTLPMGLHEENTPEAVSDKINAFLALRKAENAGGNEDIARMEAYTHTAEDIAMHLGWIIDVCSTPKCETAVYVVRAMTATSRAQMNYASV